MKPESNALATAVARGEAAILEDLAWLGFVPDEGLNPVRRQSENHTAYANAGLVGSAVIEFLSLKAAAPSRMRVIGAPQVRP